MNQITQRKIYYGGFTLCIVQKLALNGALKI